MKELTSLGISDLFKGSKYRRAVLGLIKTRNKAEFKDVNKSNTFRGTIKSTWTSKI